MSETPVVEKPGLRWFLESVLDGKRLRRVPIEDLPFRVGRRPGLGLTLPSDSVSKEHAEIYSDGETLRLRDLRSTNGTFVNRDRVEDSAIKPGDILHFADFEFRLGRDENGATGGQAEDVNATSRLGTGIDLPQHFIEGTRELTELIRDRLVEIVFQPIVHLPGRSVSGYEALGRGLHPVLPKDPTSLFRIAQSMGVESELSRLFRKKAVETLASRRNLPYVFLNTHPAELGQPDLLASLAELRTMAPQLKLVLEIHESKLADVPRMKALRSGLTKLDVFVAYDDFGAGERFKELAEVPPNYLKFDMSLIRDIDIEQEPQKRRRRWLSGLVKAADDLLIQTVAEGVETAAEADECGRLGFAHGQGFLFGRPLSADQI